MKDAVFPMTQNRALQLLFDLRFLYTTLGSRLEEGKSSRSQQDPRYHPLQSYNLQLYFFAIFFNPTTCEFATICYVGKQQHPTILMKPKGDTPPLGFSLASCISIGDLTLGMNGCLSLDLGPTMSWQLTFITILAQHSCIVIRMVNSWTFIT